MTKFYDTTEGYDTSEEPGNPVEREEVKRMEAEISSSAKAPASKGDGMEKCKPDITVDLGGRWHSIVCIKTLRAQTYLLFQDGKLDKIEQTEVIAIPK